MQSVRFIIVSALVLGIIGTFLEGCHGDADSPNSPPGNGDGSPVYGTGSLSFVAGDSGKFSVSGPYKPSALFATDTAGEGAGGFVDDTLIASRPLKAEFMAYKHTLSHGMLNDQVLVIALYDTAGGFTAGNYKLVRPDTTLTGRFAIATCIYYSDSLGLYSVYQSKSGSVTLTVVDASANHFRGSFSGLMRGVPPDTAMTFEIVRGDFDVKLGGTYFDY